jgi:ethanolamine utilization protein EutM
MTKALGMIETIGVATSIKAADEMLKNSYVNLVKQSLVDAALVTIIIEGDISAVKAAVEAGVKIAKQNSALVSFNVIPHPDVCTNQLIRQDANNSKVK